MAEILLNIILTVILIIVILTCIFMFVSLYIAVFGGGPFVPTPFKAVHKVLKAAKIKKNDVIYDIGAGDGRFVHFAAKDYGAKATGFELNPFVYYLAKLRQKFWGWKGKMIRADFTKHSIADADIIVCYMMPNTLKKFQKKFEAELKKGTKVVSYAFPVGDWKPKEEIPKDKKEKISRILVYEI